MWLRLRQGLNRVVDQARGRCGVVAVWIIHGQSHAHASVMRSARRVGIPRDTYAGEARRGARASLSPSLLPVSTRPLGGGSDPLSRNGVQRAPTRYPSE